MLCLKKEFTSLLLTIIWQKEILLEMGEIYKFLGLTSGYINNDQDDYERKKNYNFDITYATNSELGFDYLRDNMKFSKDQMVQRGAFFYYS